MKKGLLPFLVGLIGLLATFILCQRNPQPVVAPLPPPVSVAPSTPLATQLMADYAGGKVVLRGAVADEAMRTRIVDQAKAAHGADNVTDRLTVDAKLAGLKWLESPAAAAAFTVKGVTDGKVEMDGKSIVLSGTVASDAVKQSIGEAVRKQVGTETSVDNRLVVAEPPAQKRKLDAVLAGKTIEFAIGSAIITANGQRILDQIVPIIQEDKKTRVEVAGHTDNLGDEGFNVKLSAARAAATLNYLVAKGVDKARLTSNGYGSAKPIADNNTPEGQQKNRRIDFHVQEGK